MSKLTGKIAVVTGATGGLGQVVIRKFAEEGAIVVGTHSGSDTSKRIIDHFSVKFPNVNFYQVNATRRESVSEFLNLINDRFRNIQILCNLVGGVVPKNGIENITDTDWDQMFSLNVKSAFYMIGGTIPFMKASGFGRIITIGAQPSMIVEAGKSAYAASKAALLSLTQSVAEETRELPYDITANAIVPSIILTDANKEWGSEEDQKKWVSPDDIADMITYLCSHEAKSINGQIIQMYGKV